MMFAEKTLDSDWAPYFERTANVFSSAATKAAHETIIGSKLLIGPELMRREPSDMPSLLWPRAFRAGNPCSKALIQLERQ